MKWGGKGFQSPFFVDMLTIEFAHGMNIPSVNIPNTGPPTIPKIPNAAWKVIENNCNTIQEEGKKLMHT